MTRLVPQHRQSDRLDAPQAARQARRAPSTARSVLWYVSTERRRATRHHGWIAGRAVSHHSCVGVLVPALVALLAMCSSTAAAQREIGRLFPKRAEITGSGLVRLRLPADVLVETRPDLSDLRVVDPDGAEVPYVVDTATRPLGRRERAVETEPATPSEVRRSQGERIEVAIPHREVFVVPVPERVRRAGAWDLVFSSPTETFVREVELRADTEDGPIVATRSIFRLQAPLREDLRIALPPGAPATLVVVMRGDGFYLEPAMRFETALAAVSPNELQRRLEIVSESPMTGGTRYVLARPAGLVPEHLVVRTASTTYYRPIRIYDQGPSSETRALGHGVLFGAADLGVIGPHAIAIDVARAERLMVEIEDGDSPPLDEIAFIASVEEPALVMELRGRGTLYFGGARAGLPRYDLARARRTALGERLAEEPLGEATLGPIESNAEYDAGPALGYLMNPGAVIDVRPFSSRAQIYGVFAPEGSTVVRLGPQPLSKARADYADLRIVDDDDAQWPFLIEDGPTIDLTLPLPPPVSNDRTSRYELDLYAKPIRLSGIVLRSDARYFDRGYRVLATAGGTERVLAEGRLERRPGADPSELAPVEISFEPARVDSLALSIDDGDDAPLVWSEVSVRFESVDLYLVAPAGSYRLFAGDPSATLPRYELARARDLVLAVAANEVAVDAMEPNPDYEPPSNVGLSSVAMWIALAVAVVVLAIVTLFLARRPPIDNAAPAAAVSPDDDKTEPPAAPPSADPAPPPAHEPKPSTDST
jgi:hypothetical protein